MMPDAGNSKIEVGIRYQCNHLEPDSLDDVIPAFAGMTNMGMSCFTRMNDWNPRHG